MESGKSFHVYSVFWILTLWVYVFVITLRTVFQNFKFYNDWSFTYEDKPWSPSDLKIEPIIGKHYFGDFQLPISYLNLTNPYQLELPLTLGVGPDALFLLDILSIFGVRIAYLLFIMLSAGVLLVTFKKLFIKTDSKLAILIVVFGLSFSLPLFIAVDRGNSIILASSLVFYVFVVLEKSNLSKIEYLGVILAISIAVSFKIYLLLTILLILFFKNRRRNFRVLLHSFAFLFVSNFVLSFFYSSNPIEVLRNILKYSEFQSGEGQSDWLLGGVGPMRFFLNIVIHGCSESDAICTSNWQSFANIPAVLYLILVAFLIRPKSVLTNSQRMVIALSTMSNLPPVAMGYTLIWVPFSLILLLRDLDNSKSRLNMIMIGILTLMNFPIPVSGLVPWPLQDWRAIETFLTFLILAVVAVYSTKLRVFGPKFMAFQSNGKRDDR
jgi:hypothetical protein